MAYINLLERIRDIRASEKVFYRQVLEINAKAMDYAEVMARYRDLTSAGRVVFSKGMQMMS